MMIRRLPKNIRQEIERTLRGAGVRPGTTTRAARVASGGDDGSHIPWTLTTEQPVEVWDWDRYEVVKEILLVDGIRVADQIPLLDSHNRYSVDDLLGSVTGFVRDDSGAFPALVGNVGSADDKKSKRTMAKVLAGHLTDGSVGYTVSKKIWIPRNESAVIDGRTFVGPVKVSTESTLKEFSATPIGADTLAKVRSLAAGLMPGSI